MAEPVTRLRAGFEARVGWFRGASWIAPCPCCAARSAWLCAWHGLANLEAIQPAMGTVQTSREARMVREACEGAYPGRLVRFSCPPEPRQRRVTGGHNVPVGKGPASLRPRGVFFERNNYREKEPKFH